MSLDALEHWLQVPEITLHQAALLMADTDPEKFPTPTGDKPLPTGYVANIQFLGYGLIRGELPGTVARQTFASKRRKIELHDEDDLPTDFTHIDRMKTFMLVEDVEHYLSQKSRFCSFFRVEANADSMLDPSTPKYSQELAIAIRAWRSVTSNEASTRVSSPKTAIKKWLAENTSGLSGEALDRIATVVNWEPKGGAPRSAPLKRK